MLSNTFPDMSDLDYERLELSHHMNWLRNQIEFYGPDQSSDPDYVLALTHELKLCESQMAILDTFK
jgi:hypothetical protein